MAGSVFCVSAAGTDVTDDQLEDMIASGQTDVFTQNVSAWSWVAINHIPGLPSVSETHFVNMIKI